MSATPADGSRISGLKVLQQVIKEVDSASSLSTSASVGLLTDCVGVEKNAKGAASGKTEAKGAGAEIGKEIGVIKKPVLAIDVDEVLAWFVDGISDFHNEKYGTRLNRSEFFSYKFCEVWGGTDDEARDKCFEFFATSHFKNLKPVPGAFEVLSRLKLKYDLVIVTSRQKHVQEETSRWLNEHFPNIFNVKLFGNIWVPNVTERKFTKREMCAAVGAVALVDDNICYIHDVSPVTKKAILFNYQDSYGWSKCDPSTLPQNSVICYSWEDVEKELDSLYLTLPVHNVENKLEDLQQMTFEAFYDNHVRSLSALSSS